MAGVGVGHGGRPGAQKQMEPSSGIVVDKNVAGVGVGHGGAEREVVGNAEADRRATSSVLDGLKAALMSSRRAGGGEGVIR